MPDKSTLPTRRAPLSQLFQPDLEPEGQAPDAIGATVPVTIDGIETKVPMGTTILEAAKSLGVRIPTLCYHPDLEVAGICRICVVEVEGQRNLQAACAYPITAPTQGEHLLQGSAHSPPARARPATQRALWRLLRLYPQRPLRAAVLG